MRTIFALLLILLPLTASSASCTIGDSTPGTPLAPGPHGEVGVAAAGFYVFKDPAPLDVCGQDGCVRISGVGTWIYEETNRIRGLQRDDHYVDDTCRGWVLWDTPIF